jgi:hypothetical protein
LDNERVLAEADQTPVPAAAEAPLAEVNNTDAPNLAAAGNGATPVSRSTKTLPGELFQQIVADVAEQKNASNPRSS